MAKLNVPPNPSRSQYARMAKLKIEAAKFTLVGAANFVVTFLLFTVMLKILLLNYIIALGLTWMVGVLFSYFLNFSWVFRPGGSLKLNIQFIKFLSASLLSVVLNMIALNLLVEQAHFDPFYTQIALLPLIVIFNFATAKFWSLRPTHSD
jgi:putative flippase GtrA